jgi:hypothetical protein
MLVLYSNVDLEGAGSESNSTQTTSTNGNALATAPQVSGNPASSSWLDHTIVIIRHKRSEIDASSIKTAVKKLKDAYEKQKGDTVKPSIRHYVPYQRIFNCLELAFLNKTRREIIEVVLGKSPFKSSPSILGTLNLQAIPNWLVPFAEKVAISRLAFDVVIDWAVGAICFWQDNLYYGMGVGDKSGKNIDTPTTPGKADQQRARVEKAAEVLKSCIPNLDIVNDDVKVALLFEKTYRAGNTSKRALEIADYAENAADEDKQKKLKIAPADDVEEVVDYI